MAKHQEGWLVGSHGKSVASECIKCGHCDDLNSQLKQRYSRINNRPMRPLNWLSPIDFSISPSNMIDKLTIKVNST